MSKLDNCGGKSRPSYLNPPNWGLGNDGAPPWGSLVNRCKQTRLTSQIFSHFSQVDILSVCPLGLPEWTLAG